jgi:hypothetical protein
MWHSHFVENALGFIPSCSCWGLSYFAQCEWRYFRTGSGKRVARCCASASASSRVLFVTARPGPDPALVRSGYGYSSQPQGAASLGLAIARLPQPQCG